MILPQPNVQHATLVGGGRPRRPELIEGSAACGESSRTIGDRIFQGDDQ